MIRRAFTRLELVVILGLVLAAASSLTPLVRRHGHEARLAACAGNLRSLGLAVNVYAADADGYYPRRQAVAVTAFAAPNVLAAGAADDRLLLRPYLPVDLLQCPFSMVAGFSPDASIAARVESSYDLYFGHVLVRGDERTGLLRLGEPARFDGRSFAVIAADLDHDLSGFPARARYSATPDYEGFLSPWRQQNHERAASCWRSDRGNLRGGVDRQFLLADFSVRRLRGSGMYDPRLTRVPLFADHPERRAFAYLPAE